MIFLFLPGNRICNFMQTFSLGDLLHETLFSQLNIIKITAEFFIQYCNTLHAMGRCSRRQTDVNFSP